jgi:poly(glycerol-phosphate) alpha-glucosyltransferase
MLDPWALSQSRRRKQLAWHLFERGNLQRARAIQVLTTAEASAVRRLGITTPIALIPNGVALPPQPAPEAAPPLPAPWADQVPAGERVLLFLSRFHPKKGLDPLLQAWQAVELEARRLGWWLALAGYGDGGDLAGRVTAAQARQDLQRVVVLGPCFGKQKQACLASASAFVLPSLSEGLPMAALEAMAYRLPCLLSAACNLPLAFERGAALPAEPEPALLADRLTRLFQLSCAEREAMGAAGRSFVQAHYSWEKAAEQTHGLYRWMLGGGERPDFLEG